MCRSPRPASKYRPSRCLSILIGGVAFETAASDPVLPPAEANSVFPLFESRDEAFKAPPREPQTYVLNFKDSVRGLSPGAPVEMRGIQIGEVADVRAQFDAKTAKFSVPVTIHLDPQRLGVKSSICRLGPISEPFAEGSSILW